MMMMTTILVISYHAYCHVTTKFTAPNRFLVLESDRRGAEGGSEGDEMVFDQESFASKMRQFLFRSGNPRFRLAKLGNDCRVHGKEAPSSDLADWMVGKLFFDQIVENQRQEDALMGGAMEEEEWRTIWREERAEEMRERPEE